MTEIPSSKRYTPSPIDLNNKNSSQTLIADLIGENKRVLEIGTSTGYFTKILVERGNSVIGVEIDQEAAEIASIYCESMIIGDVEAIDLNFYLEASSFDVIVLGDVLEHLKYPEVTLAKIKKFLKPSGYVGVSLPNVCHGDVILNLLFGDFRYTPMGLLDETHLRFYGYRNIINIFEKCGYTIENVQVTTVPVGATEQKRDPSSVPSPILKLIKSLPYSDVYQFVFKAIPCENSRSTAIPPDVSLNQLFDYSIEEFIETHTDPLKGELKESYNRIKELDMLVKKQDNQIEEIKKSSYLLSNQIEEIKKSNYKQSKQIQEIKNRNNLLEAEIADIKQSIVWKTVTKFHYGFIERFLPPNSRRRNSYDLGLIGFRILINDGSRALLYKIRKRYRQEYSDALNIPIVETSFISPSILLSLSKILCSQFTFTENNLNEIKIFTETYKRQNSDLEFQIMDSDGHLLRKGKIKGHKILDNDYTSFKFEPIKDSKGKTFFFKVRSKGEPNAAVWYNETRTSPGLNLYYNNEHVKGSICFQAFADLGIKNPYDLWILKNEPTEANSNNTKKRYRI